jgi:hypothetical protein
LTFKLVIKILCPDNEEWEAQYLHNKLVSDGYLKPSDFGNGDILELTQKGIDFNIQEGYVASANNNTAYISLIC